METLRTGIRCIVLTAALVVFSPVVTHAYSARLAWTPIIGVSGYHVYVRRNGDAYGAPLDVGMRMPDGDGVVRYDVDGLDANATQWFAVASYTPSGESTRSNERAVGPMVASTATATPLPTATQTVLPTVTRTPTPLPTASGGPSSAPTAAPTDVYRFPLSGWRTGKSKGTWQLAFDPDLARDALVTASDQGDKLTVLYPARADLAVRLPIATFLVNPSATGTMGLFVRATNGRTYWLRYKVGAGVPSVWRQSAWIPLGAAMPPDAWRSATRDLADDLYALFGATFVEVEQAELSGTVALAELTLSDVTTPDPTAAAEMPLPLDAGSVRTRGPAVRYEYDAAMGGPTMVAASATRARTVVDVPAAPRRLAAPFGALSFVLANDDGFTVDVRVTTSVGTVVLRYDGATTVPAGHDRRLRLPLTREPVPGSDLDLVTLDMASDVAAAIPGAVLENVARVRLGGRFEIGGARFEDALAPK